MARLVLDYQDKFDFVLQSLRGNVSKMKSKFNAMECELQVSKDVTDNLTKYIKSVYRKCHENEQYWRMECLEVSGISKIIEDTALEDTVLKLFTKVIVLIDPSNVKDCHCLKFNNNAPQKVIIKLSKQKGVYRVFTAKLSFKNAYVTENGIPPNTPIIVNQSLCSYYKSIG